MEELFTLAEAAGKLRISIHTLRRYIKRGQIEVIQVGGRKRVRQSGLDRYIERNAIPETDKK